MTDMIEKVARALCQADGFVFENLPDGLVFMCSTDDGEPLPLAWGKRSYLHRARAAIEAMREPSEAMWSAGLGQSGSGNLHPADAWRHMIDAALTDARGS